MSEYGLDVLKDVAIVRLNYDPYAPNLFQWWFGNYQENIFNINPSGGFNSEKFGVCIDDMVIAGQYCGVEYLERKISRSEAFKSIRKGTPIFIPTTDKLGTLLFEIQGAGKTKYHITNDINGINNRIDSWRYESKREILIYDKKIGYDIYFSNYHSIAKDCTFKVYYMRPPKLIGRNGNYGLAVYDNLGKLLFSSSDTAVLRKLGEFTFESSGKTYKTYNLHNIIAIRKFKEERVAVSPLFVPNMSFFEIQPKNGIAVAAKISETRDAWLNNINYPLRSGLMRNKSVCLIWDTNPQHDYNFCKCVVEIYGYNA